MKKIITNVRMMFKLLKLKLNGINVFPIYVNGYMLIVEKIQ